MRSLFFRSKYVVGKPGLHLASSCWCSWLLEPLCCACNILCPQSKGVRRPLAGGITIVGIQSIAKISCNTSQAQGKSIQWAAWTNLCSINVAFQTLWQCLCSEKMVKTLLPPIITAVLPLGKQCQSRKGAQLAVTREYVGEYRMKGKTEIAVEAFLRRKGAYEERMRTQRWKMEKGRNDETFRKKRRWRREKKEEKIWREIKQNMELE